MLDTLDYYNYVKPHVWIKSQLGTPQKCEECGTSDPTKRYEWANISGKYLMETTDWKRLCKKCHVAFDRVGEKISVNYTQRLQRLRELYSSCPNFAY